MKKTLLTIVCCVAGFFAPAQVLNDNDIFYHSFRSPMSVRSNPALNPDSSSWYVSLPSFSVSATLPFSVNDVGVKYDAVRDATVVNINQVIDQLGVHNTTRFSTDIDILRVGFSVKPNLRFNLAAGAKLVGGLSIPAELAKLLTQGNLDKDGNPIELKISSPYLLSGNLYGFLSVGGAYDLNTIPLSVGGRVNFLTGIQTLAVDNLVVTANTSEDRTTLTINSDYLLHTAGLFRLDTAGGKTSVEKSGKLFSSNGFTIDLGAKYSYKNFDFSLSLLDVGPGVHWKQNTYTYTPKDPDRNYDFRGINLGSVLDGGTFDPNTTRRLIDSLSTKFAYQSTEESYWYTVPTRIYVGAAYTFNRFVRVGYLFHGEWAEGWRKNTPFYFNNTLSAMGSLFDWLEVTVSNGFSVSNKKVDFFNPGISVSFNIAKIVQLYLSADYVSNFYAADMKSARILAGINIVGYNKKKAK